MNSIPLHIPIQIITVAAPWLLFSMLTLMCGPAFTKLDNCKLIFFGMGGVIGYFLLAGAIALSMKLNAPFLSDSFNTAILVLSLLSLLVVKTSRLKNWASLLSITELALLAALALVLGLGFFHAVYDPISAWDALAGEWKVPGYAERAKMFAEQYSEGTITGESFGHRHAITNVLLMAWAGWVVEPVYGLGASIPWFLLYVSCVLVVTGYVLHSSRSTTLAILVGLCTATIPLFENHALLAGYHEMLITSVLIPSCALVCLGIKYKNTWVTVCGLALSLLLLATKSTGPAYIGCAFFGLVFALLYNRSKLAAAVMIVLSITTVFLAAQFEFGFSVGGNMVGWNPESNTIDFAGRSQTLLSPDIQRLFLNQFYAFFVNSSFSVFIAPTIVASALILVSSKGILETELVFLATTISLGLMFFIATQMTEYGMLHATFGKDTQNSRSMMPFVVLTGLYIGHLYNLANHPHGRRKSDNPVPNVQHRLANSTQ